LSVLVGRGLGIIEGDVERNAVHGRCVVPKTRSPKAYLPSLAGINTMTNPSVHDNIVYAYSILAESGQIILHTEFNETSPVEYTDVLFSGVVAHHFECSLESNILFDIDEVDVKAVLEEYAPLFQRLKNYGWPIPSLVQYADLQDLERILRERGTHAYMVNSSLGLSGFILASSIECSQRESKAFFS
jgi:hypothetical protein